MFFVYAETQFEGLHCWPEAPEPEAYLRQKHRHLFIVRMEMSTEYQNREVEINAFKRWLDDQIRWLFFSINDLSSPVLTATHPPVDLGSASCEWLAKELAVSTRGRYGSRRVVKCTVLEDGLLGAGISLDKQDS